MDAAGTRWALCGPDGQTHKLARVSHEAVVDVSPEEAWALLGENLRSGASPISALAEREGGIAAIAFDSQRIPHPVFGTWNLRSDISRSPSR